MMDFDGIYNSKYLPHFEDFLDCLYDSNDSLDFSKNS